MEKKENPVVWGQVDSFVNKHKKLYKEESLVCLAAMQQTITSLKDEDSTGGKGTIDLLTFFEAMADECNANNSKPQMSIISGSCQLRFDGLYKLTNDSNGRKIIAMNQQNKLLYAPDSNYLNELEDISFPGTIISIKFPLAQDSELL